LKARGARARAAKLAPLSSIPKVQPDSRPERDRLNPTSVDSRSVFGVSDGDDYAAERRASRAKWLRTLHGQRADWLAQLEATTVIHRRQKARRLTERARELGLQRRNEWREGGHVARNENGNVRLVSFDSQWHLSRAKGAIELFQRVESCGSENGYRVNLTCRGCAEKSTITVGCDSHWFCPACRTRRGQEYRLELQAKLGGLTSLASRAGLTARSRRHQRGGRFGARFMTLTLPHRGNTRERIRNLLRTWPRFWRMLSDELRAKLKGIPARGVQVPDVRADGTLREASLWDLVHYLWVIEWTPGDDGEGHPHLHVWLFSPFIAQDRIEELWRHAYNDVTGSKVERTIVDIRKASDDSDAAARELCKYLVKDWEVTAGGSKQAAPHVYAQAYAELDGRRMRQTSAGFSDFKLAIVKACPCCGHEAERGHWARVELAHTLTERLRLERLPWQLGPPVLTGGEVSTEEWMAQRAAERHHGEWLRSPQGEALRAFMREQLGENDNG
jgi:hypothetical protein